MPGDATAEAPLARGPAALRRRAPRLFHGLHTARRLLDLLAALACIWAAAWHTPPGALLREATARLFGWHQSARPLLAYYGGGVFAAGVPETLPLLPTRALTPEEALGYGAHCALGELGPSARAELLARAAREGFPSATLLDARSASAQLGQLLARLRGRLGSDDLAMLELFCGGEAARYARSVEGAHATLPALARALPPSLCPRGVGLAGQALALGTAASLGWPVSERARIVSPFGEREHPTLGGVRMHRGVDLAVPEGTLVAATGAGLVRRASEDAVNGRCVVLDHGHGVTTAYLHNEALLVDAGDPVARGQPISRSGSTGRSTGPHLHYQLEIAGVAVDPLLFRRAR